MDLNAATLPGGALNLWLDSSNHTNNATSKTSAAAPSVTQYARYCASSVQFTTSQALQVATRTQLNPGTGVRFRSVGCDYCCSCSCNH